MKLLPILLIELKYCPPGNYFLHKSFSKNKLKKVIIFACFFLGMFSSYSYASDLEEIVKAMHNNAGLEVINENVSENVIFNEDTDKRRKEKEAQTEVTNALSKIEAKDLEEKGHKEAEKLENQDNAAGITIKAYKKKVLSGYEELEMFKTAEEVYKDPSSAMRQFGGMSDKDCKEVINKNEFNLGKREEEKEFEEITYEKTQCEKSIDIIKCNKTLYLTCENSNECNYGGIVPGTVATDMKFELGNGVLTIGTIADNYWSGLCNIYDRTTSFELKNIDQIKEFAISQVGFDDYMLIKMNGVVVYVGPDGGNKLEVEKRSRGKKSKYNVVNNGKSDTSCERGTSWNFSSLNINLIPYLKEGKNEIFTRVIVAGRGEGWLKIRAKQHCCSKWKQEWRELCE